MSLGWNVEITCDGSTTNLAELTLPLRGTRALYIFASYLMPGANGPGVERSLFFAPEVAAGVPTPPQGDVEDVALKELLQRVYKFGRADISLKNYELTGNTIDSAGFKSMSFEARISWPNSYDAGPCQVR